MRKLFLYISFMAVILTACKKPEQPKPRDTVIYGPWRISLGVYGGIHSSTSNTYISFTDSNYIIRDTQTDWHVMPNWSYSGLYKSGKITITAYHLDNSSTGIEIDNIRTITTHSLSGYMQRDTVVILALKNVLSGKDSLTYTIP